ncbi:MAG: hypothetical protein ACHQ9S_23675 [Candidatus Binatia bacterium]
MLSKMDDYLIHQTEKPLAEVASDHPDWQETLYFNMHDRKGEFSALAGLEVFPNAQYVRAYFFALHKGEHYSYMCAGPLENWREQIRAGTLSFSVVEPQQAWRLDLADEANGIRAAVDFRARCPVYHYRPIRCEDAGALIINQSYYTQAGVYRGACTLKDQVFTDLWGLRARRWGVLVMPRLPFYHWVSLQLPTCCITAWQFESCEGDMLYCDGAVVTEAGETTSITGIEHDWTLPPGARHPTRTRLAFSTATGEILRVECKEIESHFLGAFPNRWSDADSAALAEADAKAVSTEEYCEFTLGQERGLGIVDIVSLPGYRRYGIPPLVSV